MQLINGLKRQLHRDIAADPRTHGWVLNLYLNGERYPQTVCDYFQAEYAPTRELADQIRLHEKDEHKHELLLGKAIRSLNQEVIDRKSTRLNSSHSQISYAVFCLKKKNTITVAPPTLLVASETHTPVICSGGS